MFIDQEKYFNEEDDKLQKLGKIAGIKCKYSKKIKKNIKIVMDEKQFEQKNSYTSFGKLVLADEKTNPIYSKNIIL
jgi:hypothetical protein